MIKLENISSADLLNNPIECKNGYFYAENMKGLSDFYDSFKDYIIESERLGDKIDRVKKSMYRANSKGVKPDVYDVSRNLDDYLTWREDYRLFDYTDRVSTVDDLIYCPNVSNDCRNYRYFTIEQVKFLLKHVDPTGKNALEASCRNMGKVELLNLLEMLEMYDDQVLRQYLDYLYLRRVGYDSRINLFEFNKEEKDEIVKDNFEDYIEYLLDNTKERFVWGIASDSQRKKILSATRSDNITRENLINIISNYTTLSELENDVISNHTLKRFIRK